MRLSELLDQWMACNKVTVRALAKEIGVDHTVLHRFRHGEDCNSKTLARIIAWAMQPLEVK